MRKTCKKDWDAARKRFPADKSLWLIPTDIVAKQLDVSSPFIQRLRIIHGIPDPPRRDRLPQAEIDENEDTMILSNEFGWERGHSNRSRRWLSEKFNVPIKRVEELQDKLKVRASPYRTKPKSMPVRTHSVASCGDLMIKMHTWICKPMVSQ